MNGGAIALEDSEQNKADIENPSLLSRVIRGCTFDQGKAIKAGGGGLSISNIANLQLENSLFSNNSAEHGGGGILFNCNDYGSNYDQCSLSINNCTFRANSAKTEGGAIKWNFYEPYFSDDTVFKDDNTAGIYGDLIAGVAKYLVRIEKFETNQKKI